MTSSKPLVYLVTPVFNGRAHTEAFLKTLEHQTYRNFVTVIVDDGSTDGTAAMVAKQFPDTKVLHGDGSLWWSGGTNMGVEYARRHQADYILTINNDVEVADSYIADLVATAKRHPKALIGSKVCYRDDRTRVWFFGALFGTNGDMQHVTGQDSDFTEDAESQWLTGMGVLVPTQVFPEAGLYDAVNFPQYFGDAEFSLRAKKAGYELWVSNAAHVYADVDSSWVMKQILRPKPGFVYQLFTSIRSPYQLKTRGMFYKMYWPNGWRRALLRLYSWTLLGLYRSFILASIKRLLGIKRFRDLKPGKSS